MKVSVDVKTSTFVRFWLVVIGFGLAGLMIYSARAALVLIGTAVFLALALNSPVNFIAARIPGRSRGISTAMAFFAVIGVIGTFLFFATPPIIQQTVKFAETVPNLVDSATKGLEGLDGAIQHYGLQGQVDKAVQSAKDGASEFAAQAGKNVIGGIGSLFGFIASTILVLVMSFLMLVEAPVWMQKLWGLDRNKERVTRNQRITRRMYGVVNGFITGQITVSAIGATMAGLAVFVISLFIPSVEANVAIPIALLTFVFTLIPMFGSTIAAALAALLLAVNSIPAVIIYVVYFFIYQQIENNFISPVIQSKRVELSPLAVLVAVTLGLYMFGIIGGIIFIPIAGIINVLIDEYLRYVRTERNHAKLSVRATGKKT